MIRFSKYHLLAALGLVLAYNGILGMIDSLRPGAYLPPDTDEWSAPTTALGTPVMDAELPAEQITVPTGSLAQPDAAAASIPSANPADANSPAPVTATPTSESIVVSPGTTLEVASIPDSSASDPTPVAPIEAASTLNALAKEPGRLVIPSIGLDAPIVPAKMRTIIFRGERYQQWLAPNYHAAGWHTDSALLGAIGNTVLSGHHNTLGAVFGRLVDLEIGDTIQVYSANSLFTYQVTNRMIVPEKYQQMDTRMANVQWLLPSQDERLTLITCWPDDSNTHRVIIVAAPIERLQLSADHQ
jgi:LPXTG-site transpeptidase (sortase) family protein